MMEGLRLMFSANPLTDDEIVAAAGRVAVLMGGPSAEREISLRSGRAVVAGLIQSGIDAREVIWDGDLVRHLEAVSPDRVFIALHGRGGEDGSVQGLLEIMQLPYTGSNVLGSSLSMDKVRSKQIWLSENLPTPGFEIFRRGEKLNRGFPGINYPVMVKPAREGSSIGITRVCGEPELANAIEIALRYDDIVLVENWIAGAEYTLGLLAGETLPMIKLETPHEFYDYEAKYVADTTRYLCPCGLPEELLRECTRLGVNAFELLGASGWGRVDFMLDEQQRPWLIELNTVPGMTDHSLIPIAAFANGISFDRLVVKILGTSFRGSE
jgi:D-alanine-D-alanine ligase